MSIKTHEIKLNLDSTELDETLDKVNELYETLKKANSLADELAKKDINIKASIIND